MAVKMDSDSPEYVHTNISLTPTQRAKLKRQESITGKSMSELVREAIDDRFPDPPPLIADISPNLQLLSKLDTVEKEALTQEDISSLFKGNTWEVFRKLYKNAPGLDRK